MTQVTEITPKLLAAQLAARAEEFVRGLLPNGERVGDEWAVGSPKGEVGSSCKIRLTGENAGKWKDFASNEPGGDLLDLIAVNKDIPLGKAMAEACEWLGIEKPKWGSRQRQQFAKVVRPDGARPLDKAPAVSAWLASRMINPEVLTRYRVFAQHDDTVVFPYMRDGEARHLKMRAIRDKRFWSSKDTEMCLYGWDQLNPLVRAVVLTEGELDCLAMATYGFQALSVPYGGGAKGKQDWIDNEWDRLERFDTIYLAFDPDKAGQHAIQDVVERLGRHRCRVIDFPQKDANDCLIRGVPRERIVQAVREARTLDPQELKNAREFSDKVVERFHPVDKSLQGFLMPWPSMAGAFTFEWGATTMLAGWAGHGKSELTGQIVLEAMRQGVKACEASLEFKADKLLARKVRQATGEPQPSPERIREAMNWMGEYLWAINVYGTAPADRLLEIFRYAHRRYGVRLFIIDNWSKLGIDDDDLAEQKRVINAITEFSVECNVHTIVVHHMRKADDDFVVGNKLGLKGSSSLGDMVDNIFILWRNRKKEEALKSAKFKELDEEKQRELRASPDSALRCEKYRSGDDEPRLILYFTQRSHTWSEHQNDQPVKYV